MRGIAQKKPSENHKRPRNIISYHPSKQPETPSPSLSNNIILIQLKPICPCGGGCPRCAPIIQTKLTIGQPNDKYEQEADRVADEVMRMPEPEVQPKPTWPLSQGPSCGDEDMEGELIQTRPIAEEITPLVQRQVEEDEEELVQMEPVSGKAPEATSELQIQINAFKGNGKPLSESERAFFEPRFGVDFGDVRIHTDNRAAEANKALQAKAFTVGKDVVFGTGQYDANRLASKHLFSHELAHVLQQSSGTYLRIQRRVIPGNVSCRRTGVHFGQVNLTGDEAVSAITAADTNAITLARRAEELLTFELLLTRAGEPVNRETDTILREELGLTLRNTAHFPLIQQQINRFRRVRETLESGYLRYTCLALGTRNLVGCRPSNPCRGDRATGFSCPGNRIVGLCRPFWFNPAVRAETILHEPFHIWFRMGRHARNALRRADASCFVAFALRVAGQRPRMSCVDHTAG